MHLELELGTTLCYTAVFTINGVSADDEDFGDKYDRSPESAEGYACGDMQFTRKDPERSVLDKYSISEAEYYFITAQLERGLSFGCCGWCV